MERGVTDHLAETILAYQREVKRLRAALQKIADCELEYGVAHQEIAKAALKE